MVARESAAIGNMLMKANASCRSAHTQPTASCADWCGLLASNTVAPSWRNGIFCVFCACNGVVCPSSMATLTPKVSHADFDAAAAALAHAFASGQQLPLVHLARVLDGVSHNAEQAFINSGKPANKVLEFFRSYGNVGTEPSQLLAGTRVRYRARPSRRTSDRCVRLDSSKATRPPSSSHSRASRRRCT